MPVIATAGWSIPKTVAEHFPAEGSGLERYASVLGGVEINSTFYRSHRATTYERWAGAVGEDFRFSLKLPRRITHDMRLAGIREVFSAFLEEIAPLGRAIGPLLCQLPPTLGFHADIADAAFGAMRDGFDGMLLLEPRHRSWAQDEALASLERHAIERVLADPAPVWNEASFAGPPAYVRLHGSPHIYYSRYSPEQISAYRALLGPESWCVFDNTASGAAIVNALEMSGMSA